MAISQDTVTDYYDSPYLAENYELQETYPGASRDVDVHWKTISQIRKLKIANNEPESVVVLDVGSGTGRILEGLDRLATKSPGSLTESTFIGLDQSQHMVDFAKQKNTCLTQFRKVSWICDQATDLAQALATSEGKDAKVDLLVIAIGTISHFTKPGEAQQVFNHVASVLRPHTGRACISALFMDDWSTWDEAEHEGMSAEVKDYPSKIFPETIYRNSISGYEEDGKLNTTKCKVEVIQKSPDGEEKVIQTMSTLFKLRTWTEEEFLSDIKAAGLNVLDKDTNGMDTIFILGTS
ncbi:hypothetical protein N7510_005801 [Penicillium lagena]|uniref:uncharacterized protein n=1 Tax=Penicillium lagena TaxID=94218 RepID=UPI00254038E6|nr:uncharacterized protein N7510_005801 [Penicillium lagena]KAJ5612607.1 hypothetical protein N7510_005801 [Penicillium lagena]